MKSKHTPGPWHINPDMFWRSTGVIMAGDVAVAQCSIAGRGDFREVDSKVEAHANARLIAKAPLLLQLVETLVQELETTTSPEESLRNVLISTARRELEDLRYPGS